MTNLEYQATVDQVRLAAAILADLDIAEAIVMIETCDTLAPLLDPTAWSAGSERLDAVRDMLAAARDLQRAFAEFIRVCEVTQRKVDHFKNLPTRHL